MRSEDEPKRATNTTGKTVVCLYFIASCLIATTQFIAHEFSYSPVLGKPAIGVLYSPINSFKWSIDLFSNFPSTIILAWFVGLLFGAIATGALALIALLIKKQKEVVDRSWQCCVGRL